MASQAGNEIRIRNGMDPQPPDIRELPFADPATIDEQIQNAVVVIHNRAELGEISSEDASELLWGLDATREEYGDGWASRYGVPEDFKDAEG